MLPGADGVPDPARIRTFAAGAANPVYLQIGPGGDLFYADFDGGTIRRVSFTAANQPPTAVATATPDDRRRAADRQFDGSGSSDPDAGDTLDLRLGPRRRRPRTTTRPASTPSYTYTSQGAYTASLRVTDNQGASDTDAVTISVGNTPPTATIATPAAGTTWKVGDVIEFAGTPPTPRTARCPPRALTWDADHAPLPVQLPHPHRADLRRVASGSFTAPDHEYPSYLELRLTATDSGGLTDTGPSGSTRGP